MMHANNDSAFHDFKIKCENAIEKRFPNIASMMDNVNIGDSKHNGVPLADRSNGFLSSFDSYLGKPKPYWGNIPKNPVVTFNIDPLVQAKMQNLQEGKALDSLSEPDSKKKFLASLDSIADSFMTYNKYTGGYIINVAPKGTLGKGSAFDSLITQTSIPTWNIGFSTKVYKQPFMPMKAMRLVDTDSFNNPWCDIIMLHKEWFEGFGKLTNVAMGTPEITENNPVTNTMAPLLSNVVNISIDYAAGVMENIQAQAPGNFLTAQGISDRSAYAELMLEYIQNELVYFGAGTFLGLANVATNETYSGTPFDTIYNYTSSESTTKGSLIAQAFVKLIADFMQENHYLSNEIRINVSSYVWKALNSSFYSDNYNATSPMKIIQDNFNAGNDLGGGLKSLKVTFDVDPVLDPNTAFNDNDYDLMYITVPSVNSALGGEQTGLVIAPVPLDRFVVPPYNGRSGLLYTSYKRVGSIVAPIEGTVKVYKGIGYQG